MIIYKISSNQLLPFMVLVFLTFISCEKKEEVNMPGEEEIVNIEEPEENEEGENEEENPIVPCPFGTYNGVVVSYQNSRAEIDALGASVVHSWFQWDFVEENLSAPFLLEDEVTEEMIEKYATGERGGIDWSLTDSHVNEFAGLDMVMGVGSGWKNSMPLFNGEKITPDIIGRDEYIGQLYLHTRACVRRYKEQVTVWQIENEPNISQILMALGHREGDAWNDINFMTRVLMTLEKAVKTEDPNALVTINFFIDVNNYQTDIERWSSLVDIVGVDSYQDVFTPDPRVAADTILHRIAKISDFVETKPVMILETGYSSGPVGSAFTEENQKVFIEEIYSKIDDFNGCGVLYFKHSTSEQSDSGLFPSKHYRGLIKDNNEGKLAWHFLQEFFQ